MYPHMYVECYNGKCTKVQPKYLVKRPMCNSALYQVTPRCFLSTPFEVFPGPRERLTLRETALPARSSPPGRASTPPPSLLLGASTGSASTPRSAPPPPPRPLPLPPPMRAKPAEPPLLPQMRRSRRRASRAQPRSLHSPPSSVGLNRKP